MRTSNPALLLMAHGSPQLTANRAIERIVEDIRDKHIFSEVVLSFMELNEPSIPAAIDTLIAKERTQIVAVPYFLQLGGHVAEDLPAVMQKARLRYPHATIQLADYLSYDPLLLAVIKTRIECA